MSNKSIVIIGVSPYQHGNQSGISIEYCSSDNDDDSYGSLELYSGTDARGLRTWYYYNNTHDDSDKSILSSVLLKLAKRTEYIDRPKLNTSITGLYETVTNNVASIRRCIFSDSDYDSLKDKANETYEYLKGLGGQKSDDLAEKYADIADDDFVKLINHYESMRLSYADNTCVYIDDDHDINHHPDIERLNQYLNFANTYLFELSKDLNKITQ